MGGLVGTVLGCIVGGGVGAIVGERVGRRVGLLVGERVGLGVCAWTSRTTFDDDGGSIQKAATRIYQSIIINTQPPLLMEKGRAER